MDMTSRQRHFFTLPMLLLLLLLGEVAQSCRHALVVSSSDTSTRRGKFFSGNYPHSLPVGSRCTYEFSVRFRNATEALCIRFKQLQLHTANQTELSIGAGDELFTLLEYTSAGQLSLQLVGAEKYLFQWPSSLYRGPICLRTLKSVRSYFLVVRNDNDRLSELGRVTQFEGEFTIEDSSRLKPHFENSSRADQHHCLDGSVIANTKRCDSRLDCVRSNSISDFFPGVSSDESYEHARCSSARNFGTNFALNQASAHRIPSDGARLDCSTDHSHHFGSSANHRDCSVKVQLNNSSRSASLERPVLELSGVKLDPVMRVGCYRFFWKASGFRTDSEALALAESNGGRVLLRLPIHEHNDTWNLAEIEIEWGHPGESLELFSIASEQRTRTGGAHWLDDLSAEAAACSRSQFESRMPSVCSFEWARCGWDFSQIFVTTSARVSTFFGVAFSDHTSSMVPGRRESAGSQSVLQIVNSVYQANLVSTLRFPSKKMCFEIWFYALGTSGFSSYVHIVVYPTIASQIHLNVTRPNNQWYRLGGMVDLSDIVHPDRNLAVFFLSEIMWNNNLRAWLFDDLSLTEGACPSAVSDDVQCGSREWRCANREKCILSSQVCDLFRHCSDSSDEKGCFMSRYIFWLLGAVGVIVLLINFGLIYRRWKKRRTVTAREVGSTMPRLSAPGRTQVVELQPIRSTTRGSELPPTYEEAVQRDRSP